MRILLSVLILGVLVPVVYSDEMQALMQTDSNLRSGEVTWNMNYEIFLPSQEVPLEFKPVELSDEDFKVWNGKLKGYRSQDFEITAKFSGNYVYFECLSDAGDVKPIPSLDAVSYNGVSVTMIDNVIGNMFRESVNKTFIETAYSSLLIPPKYCGYNFKEIMSLTKRINGTAGDTPLISFEHTNASKIVARGKFSNGEVTLAEFTLAALNAGYCSTIKFINPAFKERVLIENSDFVSYDDGTVFPNRTVVTRYLGGDLDNLSNQPVIDRKTLTVIHAKFNHEIPDHVFNPSLPEGYNDLNNPKTEISQ